MINYIFFDKSKVQLINRLFLLGCLALIGVKGIAQFTPTYSWNFSNFNLNDPNFPTTIKFIDLMNSAELEGNYLPQLNPLPTEGFTQGSTNTISGCTGDYLKMYFSGPNPNLSAININEPTSFGSTLGDKHFALEFWMNPQDYNGFNMKTHFIQLVWRPSGFELTFPGGSTPFHTFALDGIDKKRFEYYFQTWHHVVVKTLYSDTTHNITFALFVDGQKMDEGDYQLPGTYNFMPFAPSFKIDNLSGYGANCFFDEVLVYEDLDSALTHGYIEKRFEAGNCNPSYPLDNYADCDTCPTIVYEEQGKFDFKEFSPTVFNDASNNSLFNAAGAEIWKTETMPAAKEFQTFPLPRFKKENGNVPLLRNIPYMMGSII